MDKEKVLTKLAEVEGDVKVFSHLKNNIKDFPKFKSEIVEFLRTKK